MMNYDVVFAERRGEIQDAVTLLVANGSLRGPIQMAAQIVNRIYFLVPVKRNKTFVYPHGTSSLYVTYLF